MQHRCTCSYVSLGRVAFDGKRLQVAALRAAFHGIGGTVPQNVLMRNAYCHIHGDIDFLPSLRKGGMHPMAEPTWNLNGVAVSVNGEPAGDVQAEQTLAQVVQQFARSRGIQSATVYAGDRKLLPADGSKTLQELGVSGINIVTKDQRA